MSDIPARSRDDAHLAKGAARNRAPRLTDVLPVSLPPRGLSRVEAAAYIGISPSLFDVMVGDGRMPKPKRINARTVWDRLRLDVAFAALPDDGCEVADKPDAWGDLAV